MADIGEPIVRVGKIDEGIRAACDVADSLGLSLLERWKVFYSLEVASRKLLGDAFDELVEKWTEEGLLPRRAGEE